MKPCVVVGISGGVAAFKSVQLVSDLIKMGIDVEVIMTKNACEFIKPLQFEALTNHSVMIDTFDDRFERSTQHISIAKKCDCFVVAPATANFIAKAAHGIADDMLTTTFLACTCPKLIVPAMNTQMLENPITQNNIRLCKEYGMRFIESEHGHLACGDVGKGKMANISVIKEAIVQILYPDDSLAGKKVLISVGATQEAIDPVRFITNHSSGKMGCALAQEALNRKAEVILVAAHIEVTPPNCTLIQVSSAKEMAEAIKQVYDKCDVCIKAAAVSDYTLKTIASQKIKKSDQALTLQLTRTEDILKWCGEHKTKQVLVGFAMETENLIENAKAKCINKNCDFVVANSLVTKGAGFQNDTNVITLISPNEIKEYELMSKADCAKVILDQVKEHLHVNGH